MHVLIDKPGTLFGQHDTPPHWLAPDSSRQIANGIEIMSPPTPGFGTRLSALYLPPLLLLAIAAVHIGHSYTIPGVRWKLLLILSGPGFRLHQLFRS